VAEGCLSLGLLYERGVTGAVDLEAAAKWYRTACEQNSMSGCAALGVLLIDAEPPLGDKVEGRSLLERGCDGGPPGACLVLAKHLDGGTFGQSLPQEATERFARACDGGDAEGCATLAERYWKGVGVDKDKDLARKLYARACSKGLQDACKRAR
jgi:hypothetical protein